MNFLIHIANASGVESYHALAPIGNFVPQDVSVTNLTAYLNGMFKLGIAIAGALAVIMIIWGGIQYMSTDSITGQSEGKKKIIAAITGLIVALGSYMLLNTISPDLLKTDLNLQPVVVIGIPALHPGDPGYPFQPGDTDYGSIIANATPINCTGGYGDPFNPNLTAYSPQAGGDKLEGGYESSIPGLDGKSVVRTLDDVLSGQSDYVTLAGDPSQYGKTYVIPSITYTTSSGQKIVLNNVTGYVHDTGSAFRGAGNTHYDVAIGRDYSQSTINSQQFTGGNTTLNGCQQ